MATKAPASDALLRAAILFVVIVVTFWVTGCATTPAASPLPQVEYVK